MTRQQDAENQSQTFLLGPPSLQLPKKNKQCAFLGEVWEGGLGGGLLLVVVGAIPRDALEGVCMFFRGQCRFSGSLLQSEKHAAELRREL